MKRTLPARRPSPAMVVALVALISSLVGGAAAATLITGADIKNGSVTNKDIGAGAVRSKQVKNGALLAKDFRAGELRAGPRGPQGVPGPKGDPCLPADPACVGPKGDPGAQGLQGIPGDNGADGQDLTHNSVLPSGQTLRGVWAVSGGVGGSPVETVDFRPRLPADIPSANVHYLGGGPNASCPGAGQAAAGHFCVYPAFSTDIAFDGSVNPFDGDAGADVTGAVLYFTSSHAAAVADGTWAVTAP